MITLPLPATRSGSRLRRPIAATARADRYQPLAGRDHDVTAEPERLYSRHDLRKRSNPPARRPPWAPWGGRPVPSLRGGAWKLQSVGRTACGRRRPAAPSLSGRSRCSERPSDAELVDFNAVLEGSPSPDRPWSASHPPARPGHRSGQDQFMKGHPLPRDHGPRSPRRRPAS